MNDPILKLIQLAGELWNERKGLSYTNRKKLVILNMLKLIKEIKSLDLMAELTVLCELSKIDKSILE